MVSLLDIRPFEKHPCAIEYLSTGLFIQGVNVGLTNLGVESNQLFSVKQHVSGLVMFFAGFKSCVCLQLQVLRFHSCSSAITLDFSNI